MTREQLLVNLRDLRARGLPIGRCNQTLDEAIRLIEARRVVYALELSHQFDGDQLIGVHATRESAIAATKGSAIVGEFYEKSKGFWKAGRSDDYEWHITEQEVTGA